jgi:hypothetical protein
MATIDTFDAYGERFRFEPPVEVGSHTIDSLGKLAAVAWCGPEANTDKIDALTDIADQTLMLTHGFSGTHEFADFLSETASKGSQTYTVTID